MATAQQNLAKFQEIARRGLQDQLPPEIKARFDEAVRRGLVEVEPETGINTFLEPAKTLATGAAGEVVGGLTGLGTALATGDINAGVGVQERVRDRITQEPETEQGRAGLEAVGEFAQTVNRIPQMLGSEQTFGESFEAAGQTLGDIGAKVAEPVNPALGFAVGASIPTAVAELIGLKGGGRVVREASKVDPTVARRVINEQFAQMTNRPIVAVDESGRFSDDALRIIEQQKGPDAVEEARRFNLFQETGVTPTRANVTQSTDDFRLQQESLKESGPISEAVSRQDAELQAAVSRQIGEIAPTAEDVAQTNDSVFSAINSTVNDLDEQVQAAYQLAREQASPDAVVKPDNLIDYVRKNVKLNERTGGTISAIRGILQNRGLLEGLQKVENRGLRIQDAELLRQDLNDLFEGANPQARKVLREAKNALDSDVAAVVPEDVFAPARQAKVRMQERIERARRDKRDKTRGSLLEDIIDNKISEDKIFDKLTAPGTRLDDFRSVKNFLLDSGEEGIQAWNNIRAQTIREALERATSTMGKGEGGQVVFNANKFNQTFNRLRKRGAGTSKYTEMFGPKERKMIENIQEVGFLRIPARSVQAGEGPSARVVEVLREQLSGIPGIGPALKLLSIPVTAVRETRRINRALDAAAPVQSRRP